MKNSKIKSSLFFIPVFLLLLHTIQAEGKQRVTLFETTLINTTETEGKIITSSLKKYIFNNKNLINIDFGKIQELTNLLNIDVKKMNDSEAFQVGESLDSDLLLLSTLKKENGEYNLKIRLLDVKTKKTLYTESESFDSILDSKKAVDKITGTIFEGEINLDHYFYFSAGLNYLYPINRYAEIVNPGLGVSISAGIDNLLINRLNLIFETGYYRFYGAENNSDYISHIPAILVLGYRFTFFNLFSIMPIAGGGLSYITIYHDKGVGFSIDDNSEITEILKTIKSGLTINLTISQSTSIFLTTTYNSDFDKKRLDFININIGIQNRL